MHYEAYIPGIQRRPEEEVYTCILFIYNHNLYLEICIFICMHSYGNSWYLKRVNSKERMIRQN